MSFHDFDLDPNILKAIDLCGYTKPTPVQAKAIPLILAGHDLIARADTGTGKTAAFVLPALQKLSVNASKSKPRVLILTPTRELASQITSAANLYGKFMRFQIISLVGGMSYRTQLRDLSRSVDIVVATPGRLLDHMESRKIDLSQIEMLVLDEADRMLDMGFIDDVNKIAKATPKTRQTLLFSATIDKNLNRVIADVLKNPERVEIEKQKNDVNLIQQNIYITDNQQHKNRLLQHFLDDGNIFKGIIFSATKIHCDNLANHLMELGYSAAPLHGDLKQSQRNRTIELLRKGKIQFLIATDVAARGIDIPDVTHVINYDLPKFSEDYVHRIGRTGRAGKTGKAISFVLPSDARHLKSIERYIGKSIDIDVIAGLEPTKRMTFGKSADNASPSRKRGGSSGKKYESSRFGDKKYPDKKRSYSASSEERSFGREKSFSKERSFNKDNSAPKDRSFAKEKSFSKDRDFGKERSFPKVREFNKEKSFSKDRDAGKERSFSKDRDFGKERNFSKDRDAGKARSFSKDRDFGKERSFSKDKPSGKERSFSKERSFTKAPRRFDQERPVSAERPSRFEKKPRFASDTRSEKLGEKRGTSSRFKEDFDSKKPRKQTESRFEKPSRKTFDKPAGKPFKTDKKRFEKASSPTRKESSRSASTNPKARAARFEGFTKRKESE